METTEETKVVPPENGSTETESSADKTWDSEKYPAWQKQIGKEYWGHEKLKDFDSIKSVMEAVINPKKKAPEKYEGFSDELSDVCEVLRTADVGEEDAKKLSEVLGKHIPKKFTEDGLKEIYGADYEVAEKNFSRAVEKVLTDEKDRKAFKELKNNPILFKFVSAVGRNLDDSSSLNIGKPQVVSHRSDDPFMDLLLGKK